MNKELNIGVIGAGSRSRRYLDELQKEYNAKWKLGAIMDPNKENADISIRNYGNSETQYYSNLEEMLDNNEFDGVILASPNKYHLEQVIPVFRKNINLLLEKPIATTIDDCKKMVSEYEKSNAQVILGFVLRYSPFYRKVKEICDSGKIGNILSINATESISNKLSTVFIRAWRKHRSISGPFILEKCCHDVDTINSFVDSKVIRVASFERSSYFTEDNRKAPNCNTCAIKDECIYDADFLKDDEDGVKIKGLSDECVYQDLEHSDHQVVNLEYENGILATFSYAWGQPDSTRTIHIFGTNGRIWGNISENSITVEYFENRIVKKEEVQVIVNNSSGHFGADKYLSDKVFEIFSGKEATIRAGMREGFEAALVALAIDKSSREGRIVNMNEIW
jgi:predicted dehydrogenase